MTICFIFGLSSCEYQEKNNGNVPISKVVSIQEKIFDDLILFKSFNESYSKIAKNIPIANATQGKTALENQYGFTIDADTPIKIIAQQDSTLTYVMLVSRVVEENLKFENLIMRVKNNETKADLIKYELNEKAEKDVVHNSYKMDIKEVTVTSLEIDGKFDPLPFTSYFAVLMCDNDGGGGGGGGAPHVAGPGCIHADNGPHLYVDWGSSTTGPGTHGQNSNSWNANSGSGGNGGAVTIPTPSTQVVASPCEDLSNKEQNQDFIDKMADLTARVAANQNYESGYAFNKLPIDDEIILTARIDGDPNDFETGGFVDIGFGSSQTQTITNCQGFMHTHISATSYQVFSGSDLLALAEIANLSTQPTNQITVYVVTSAGQFAIKIKDRVLLRAKYQIMKATFDSSENKFDFYVKKNSSLEAQKLGLLKFMKNQALDQVMDLYQKDTATGNWSKQNLSPNGTAVLPTNCN